MGQIIGAVLVDGDAERLHAPEPGLEQGLAGIFNAVFAMTLAIVAMVSRSALKGVSGFIAEGCRIQSVRMTSAEKGQWRPRIRH